MNDYDNDEVVDDPTVSPSRASEESGTEPVDIDASLENVGLHGDEEGVKPLDLEDELEDEL